MVARRSPVLAALAVAVAAAVTIAIAAALGGAGGTQPAGRQEIGAVPSTSAVASPAAVGRSSVAASAGTSVGPSAVPPSATPTPPVAPLPALVGAIGDSLTVAVNAEPRFGDQPAHSWVVGDDPADGVESHLERLRALGAEPDVVMAARPGAAIGTAVAQAERVVAAARESGRTLMVGHLLEYHPGLRQLKELADSGELGDIR
jgi:hypothetical protein